MNIFNLFTPKEYVVCKVSPPHTYYVEHESGNGTSSLKGVKIFSSYNKALKEIDNYKKLKSLEVSTVFIILEIY